MVWWVKEESLVQKVVFALGQGFNPDMTPDIWGSLRRNWQGRS